jgi:hypothetical protein
MKVSRLFALPRLAGADRLCRCTGSATAGAFHATYGKHGRQREAALRHHTRTKGQPTQEYVAQGTVIKIRNGKPIQRTAGTMVQGVNGVHHWWESRGPFLSSSRSTSQALSSAPAMSEPLRSGPRRIVGRNAQPQGFGHI